MRDLFTSTLVVLAMTIILGIVYPLTVSGIAQTFFPVHANGSLIRNTKGEVIGSELIGQNFTSPVYFHGRLSSAGNGYDAAASGGSNLGPTSEKLIKRVMADAASTGSDNPGVPIPADLVTTSASGLDPHISPAAADFQVPRVARYRGLTESKVRAIVERFTEGRQLGILGEPRVNVLLLNIELDRIGN